MPSEPTHSQNTPLLPLVPSQWFHELVGSQPYLARIWTSIGRRFTRIIRAGPVVIPPSIS